MILDYSDNMIIEGLRQRKSSCISYIYEEFGPIVRHLVKKNSGTQQDTEDLIQDALIVLYKRSMGRSFNLECSLKTYFISICKNLWMQRLERKFRLLYQSDFEVREPPEVYSPEEQALTEETLEINRLFYKNLMLLPTECQRIIKLYCLGISYKEIARMLKYKDEIYVKTRKYSCKELLRKKIMIDPECYQFIEYERICNNRRLD
ncbi:MAG: sigma-70 family RNA polymerase sigma factor [Bacteroidota bacterium]